MHETGLANILSAMGIGRTKAAMLACAALASPAQAATVEPLVLEPSSPWIADFKEESCAVRRTFSGEGQQVTVEFDNFLLGDYFDVVISGVTLKQSRGTLRAGFEPDDNFSEHSDAVIGDFTGSGHGILYGDTVFRSKDGEARAKGTSLIEPYDDDLRASREKEITGLFVAGAFERDLRFETGALAKPMTVMRQCIDDLVKSRSLIANRALKYSRPVKPKDPKKWLNRTLANYPSELREESKSAMVFLRLLIDETGKVIDCGAQPRGEDARFDKVACDGALRYAEFIPALDAAGKPAKAYYTTRMTFSPD